MMLNRIFAMLLAFMLVPAFSVRAEERQSNSALKANAALDYWLAFASLSQDEKRKEILDQWDTVALDGAASELAAQHEQTLLHLQRGAALDDCEWNLHLKEDGFFALLPHLSKARELGKLALLRARLRFNQGRIPEGMEDVRAVFKLSRDVGSEPLLISMLIQIALEKLSVDFLAENLPRMDPAALRSLALFLDEQPAIPAAKDALLFEMDVFVEWLSNWVKVQEERGTLAASLPGFWRRASGEDARQLITSVGTTAPAWLAVIEETAQCYDRTSEILDLPIDQIESKWQELETEILGTNDLVDLIHPSPVRAAYIEAEAKARRSMLRAAVAILLDGQETLRNTKDPFGNGPFAYRPAADGFQLVSALMVQKRTKDAPKGAKELVTLTVGTKTD